MMKLKFAAKQVLRQLCTAVSTCYLIQESPSSLMLLGMSLSQNTSCLLESYVQGWSWKKPLAHAGIWTCLS